MDTDFAKAEDTPQYPGAVRAKNMVVTLLQKGPSPLSSVDIAALPPGFNECLLKSCDGIRTLFELARMAEERMGCRLSREQFGQLVEEFRGLEKSGAVKIAPKFLTTPEQFRDTLVKLGVAPEMRLLMHSSYASLGTMQGGPEAVLKMLMELLTPEGVLMLPTFNFYKFDEDGVFDPRNTPSQVGILTNVFRTMPGVHRSLHPTHSFAAWGKDAENYVRSHHLVDTMGKGSPMDLMAKDDGWILLVDCPTTVTYMHFVETSLHAQCIHPSGEEYPVRYPDGIVRPTRTWSWRNGYCTPSNLLETWKLMRQNQWLHEADFACGHMMFFQFKTFGQCHAQVLQRHGNCDTCTRRPRLVPQTLPELKPLFAKYNPNVSL